MRIPSRAPAAQTELIKNPITTQTEKSAFQLATSCQARVETSRDQITAKPPEMRFQLLADTLRLLPHRPSLYPVGSCKLWNAVLKPCVQHTLLASRQSGDMDCVLNGVLLFAKGDRPKGVGFRPAIHDVSIMINRTVPRTVTKSILFEFSFNISTLAVVPALHGLQVAFQNVFECLDAETGADFPIVLDPFLDPQSQLLQAILYGQ